MQSVKRDNWGLNINDNYRLIINGSSVFKLFCNSNKLSWKNPQNWRFLKDTQLPCRWTETDQ